MPGVARGFHLMCRVFAAPGDAVLVQPPVYPPILKAHTHVDVTSQEAELTRMSDGSYGIDLDAFEHAITPETRIFLLCNPHNPVGRAFRREELAAMADICLRHNVLICSDEIHCDIVFSGHHHTPIASLAPEIAQQTVTLIAPSKTFNIPGLKCAVAIIQNAELRERFCALEYPLAGKPNVLGLVAALAAYRDCQPWLDDLLAYLEANRDYVYDYVRTSLPTISMAKPEATFLAWLDCRQAAIPGPRPCEFFIDNARVALNDGATFGPGGEGFVRLNFGCPRSTLVEALERLRQQMAAL
jgi:cystathionine beta-lyase